MLVVGGIYQERCNHPDWDQIFGSAGRAACIISGVLGQKVALAGWYSKRGLPSLQASFAPYNVQLDVRLQSKHAIFDYFHPLSSPRTRFEAKPRWTSLDRFSSDVILMFGSLEGIPNIWAKRLIIDPQGESISDILDSKSFVAGQISIVANETESSLDNKLSLQENVKRLFELDSRISVVVVKRGPLGAAVFQRRTARYTSVSSYRSNSVFKIGSGDAFSAAYSFAWGIGKKSPYDAADYASRITACYVNNPYLNFAATSTKQLSPIAARRNVAEIYLAGPFFTLADHLLLRETRYSLSELGAKVFSPLHHVGTGIAKSIAKADLRGLRKSKCDLALLHTNDPGTLFEVGYARSQRIPVVALCERANECDITMLAGTDCDVETDFCTALYKAVWAALEK